jgi:uncharacterized membrane protein YkoI
MKRLVLIAAAIAALAPGMATAQGRGDFGAGRNDQDRARDARQQGRHLPLSAVLARIAASTPGRQLNTQYGERGGQAIYIIQWLTPDGRVIIFVVDAESGSIISRQGG